jgi:flagella basal body P-ring formation protein FlgA
VERTSVDPKTSPVLVKRQQQVILKIDTELLQISAHGEAMEDGRAGDLIRVRRGSRTTGDERFVVGRIMSDGSVQPVLN